MRITSEISPQQMLQRARFDFASKLVRHHRVTRQSEQSRMKWHPNRMHHVFWAASVLPRSILYIKD